MDIFLLEHCGGGNGTNLLGAYGSRQAAEDALRELPQDERYTVTEAPVGRRISSGLADNMGSLNHWHYRGCVEDRDDAALAERPRLGGCYHDGVVYCLAYDTNGVVELDGPTFTSLSRGIDGGAAQALRRHAEHSSPEDLPRFVVALRLERVVLRPERVALRPEQGASSATAEAAPPPAETEAARPRETLADQVRSLCRAVMKRASHVHIVYESAGRLGQSLTAQAAPVPRETSREEAERLLFRELAANAVNYCYWWGRHDIRPGDGGSSEMYRLLDASILDAPRAIDGISVAAALDGFAARLRDRRFPLCDRRTAHLRELAGCHGWVRRWARRLASGAPADDFLRAVAAEFPGYAADVFLKRAFLLATELHRIAGWLDPDMRDMPIPADYQIPKMLRHLGCLAYSDELAAAVDSGAQIPRGSAMECEIRAASILACDAIAEAAGANPCDVDSLLWSSRKSCGDPFHLTVTTDY